MTSAPDPFWATLDRLLPEADLVRLPDRPTTTVRTLTEPERHRDDLVALAGRSWTSLAGTDPASAATRAWWAPHLEPGTLRCLVRLEGTGPWPRQLDGPSLADVPGEVGPADRLRELGWTVDEPDQGRGLRARGAQGTALRADPGAGLLLVTGPTLTAPTEVVEELCGRGTGGASGGRR